MIRVRRALLASALTTLLATPALAGTGACAGRFIHDDDGWTTVLPPDFAAGEDRIAAYVAHPADPGYLWVTNGAEIRFSDDGGCVFTAAFAAPLGSTVTSLTVVDGVPYATLDTPAGPRVVAGGTFLDVSTGLPPAGVADPVTGGPGTGYVLVHAGPGAQLFARRGAGAWQPVVPDVPALGVPPVTEPATTRLLTRVYADPADPARLWGVVRLPEQTTVLGDNLHGGQAEGLYRSADGGRSWTQVSEVTSVISTVDVAPGATYVYMALVRQMWATTDGGATWEMSATPGDAPALSATHGVDASDIVVSLPGALGRVQRYDAGTHAWKGIRHGGPVVDDLSAVVRGARTTILGRTAEGVVRYVAPTPVPKGKPPLPPDVTRCRDYLFAYGVMPPPGHVGDPRPRTLKQVPDAGPAPRVSPATPRVTIPVGGHRTVPVDVVPPRVPVDLFFLVDDTGSMGDEICAIARSVQATVARLAGAGLDARFGLAEFGDYETGDPDGTYTVTIPPDEDEPVGTGGGTHPYQLRRKIGLADDELAEKFAALRAGWGGTRPEAGLTAIHQAVTGAGEDSEAPGPSRNDIPPGGDAGFRPHAQKFLLVVTDAMMHNGPSGQGNDGFPGPKYPEVVRALRRHGVRVIGLSTANDAAPLGDLNALARDSGAVTPVPLDCNGDGIDDVPRGRPAVCEVDGDSGGYFDMAATMTNLVRSLPVPGTLRLDAAGAGPVTAAVGDPARRIDRKRIQRVPFAVEVSCERPGSGDVVLTQRVDRAVTAAGGVAVDCVGALPVAPPEPPVGVVPPPLPIPPQPPAPQPRIEVAGQAQPQSQAQAQSQANPNAATVPQRQEQPQVAGVTVAQPREQLATSRRFRPVRRRAAPSPLPVAAAGLAMAFAYGVHLARSPARQWR